MCGGGGGNTPAPPPILPEAPDASRQVRVGKDSDKRRRAASGQQGTILTGARGLLPDQAGATQTSTLLGG